MTKTAPFHLGDVVLLTTATYGEVTGIIRDIFMDGNDGPFAYVETNVCPLPYRAHLESLRLADAAGYWAIWCPSCNAHYFDTNKDRPQVCGQCGKALPYVADGTIGADPMPEADDPWDGCDDDRVKQGLGEPNYSEADDAGLDDPMTWER